MPPATTPTAADSRLDRLHEQAAAQRHGGSVYAPAGERSWPQREYDGLAFLELLQRVSLATGRAEGYRAGFEAGHRAGRLDVWRLVGTDALVASIRTDLERIRAELGR